MTRSNRLKMIDALQTNPRLLDIQIKSKEISIKSIQWSIDWHIKNTPNASMNDSYVLGLLEQIQSLTNQIEIHKYNKMINT
jgi:1,2-phenylacetyl-CoA epoxidase catalytic subunit